MKLTRGTGLFLALMASAAAAQTTGQIVGEVRAADTGAPLPFAEVVATAPELQGQQRTVTEADGRFVFTLLPPGTYALTARRQGFQPLEQKAIVLPVGRTLRVDLELLPESVRLDEVLIVAESPLVDQASTTTGVVLGHKLVESIPAPRTFQGIAELAPGAQGDLYGISLSGATSIENSYLIDGVSVGNPAFGLLGTNLPTDFIQETEVKTGGYRAEFGRSAAGIVNVLTKRGGNNLHGSVFFNVTPLAAERTAIGRAGEAIAEAQTGVLNTDFGLELGGPVLPDRVWFYLGFAPFFDRTDYDRIVSRLVDEDNDGVADQDEETGLTRAQEILRTPYSATRRSYDFVGKLTWQLNEDNRVELSGYGDPTASGGAAGELAVDRITGAPYGVNGAASARESSFVYGGTDLGLSWSSRLLARSLILEARAGYHRERSLEEPLRAELADVPGVRHDVTRSLAEYDEGKEDARILAACQDPAGSAFVKCPVTRYLTGGLAYTDNVTLDRIAGGLKLSYFLQAGGAHVFKGGVDYERSTYDNVKRYSGGVFMREREAGGQRFYEDFRRFGFESPAGSGQAKFLPELAATTRTLSTGLFVQDSWTVLDLFTVDLGLRWELQDLTDDEGQSAMALYDNFAPRVGLTFDWTRKGKGKVYGYFGRFYEMIPLDIADRSFALEPSVFARRDPTSCEDPKNPATCALIPLGAGTHYLFMSTERSRVAEDIEGQYSDQIVAGWEYELAQNLGLKLEYTNNRLGQVIEDVSVDDGVTFFIGNPGYGEAEKAVKADGTVVTFPKPVRRYDAFTLSMNKVFGSGWQGLASYTYARLRGNYNGLFKENGQIDPNITSDFDLADLLTNREGPLPGDVPHQFKLDGSYAYALSPDVTLVTGLSLRAQSGTPVSTLGGHLTYGAGEAHILPRGTAACRVVEGGQDCSDRTPPLYRADARLRAVYRFAKDYTLEASVDVFNILNWQEVTQVDENYTFDAVYPIAGGTRADLAYLKTTQGDPVMVNKNYGNATARQAPRTVRFGARVTF